VTFDLTLRCERWGAYSDARVRVRRYDRLRLLADEYDIELGKTLRVHAERIALRAVAHPHETAASVGDEGSRAKGEGIERGKPLRVHAERIAWRAVAHPHETAASVGDEVSRAKGEGIELAELRPFVAGDDLRGINWRATARAGELVVNQLHPERTTTVVRLIAVLTDLGSERGAPLDQGVQAASALAERYLARRDRVGLLAVGGGLRLLSSWSGPHPAPP